MLCYPLSCSFWAASGTADANQGSLRDNPREAAVQLLLEVIATLVPDCKHRRLQLGCYRRGDFIETHDDAAYGYRCCKTSHGKAKGCAATSIVRRYADSLADDGRTVLCSRDIAVIFYLTPGWQSKFGGLLIDHSAGGEVIVPEFNSLVAFRVPRLHEVRPKPTHAAHANSSGWRVGIGAKLN
jgi:hypothetical protein